MACGDYTLGIGCGEKERLKLYYQIRDSLIVEALDRFQIQRFLRTRTPEYALHLLVHVC